MWVHKIVLLVAIPIGALVSFPRYIMKFELSRVSTERGNSTEGDLPSSTWIFLFQGIRRTLL